METSFCKELFLVDDGVYKSYFCKILRVVSFVISGMAGGKSFSFVVDADMTCTIALVSGNWLNTNAINSCLSVLATDIKDSCKISSNFCKM